MINRSSIILHHCHVCEHKFESKPSFNKDGKLVHMGFKKKCPNCQYTSGPRGSNDFIYRRVGTLDTNGRVKLILANPMEEPNA